MNSDHVLCDNVIIFHISNPDWSVSSKRFILKALINYVGTVQWPLYTAIVKYLVIKFLIRSFFYSISFISACLFVLYLSISFGSSLPLYLTVWMEYTSQRYRVYVLFLVCLCVCFVCIVGVVFVCLFVCFCQFDFWFVIATAWYFYKMYSYIKNVYLLPSTLSNLIYLSFYLFLPITIVTCCIYLCYYFIIFLSKVHFSERQFILFMIHTISLFSFWKRIIDKKIDKNVTAIKMSTRRPKTVSKEATYLKKKKKLKNW